MCRRAVQQLVDKERHELQHRQTMTIESYTNQSDTSRNNGVLANLISILRLHSGSDFATTTCLSSNQNILDCKYKYLVCTTSTRILIFKPRFYKTKSQYTVRYYRKVVLRVHAGVRATSSTIVPGTVPGTRYQTVVSDNTQLLYSTGVYSVLTSTPVQ